MTKRLSPNAQKAAAMTYVNDGLSLDQIKKTYPSLAEGVELLRDAETAAPSRSRGSGPGEPETVNTPTF
jgi:hypothetical protein